MDLMTLAAKLTLDSSDYNKGIDEAEQRGSKLGGVLGKIGGVAKGAVMATGAAITAAGGAIAKIAKSAYDAYANYQQLEGGIETLFGDGGKSLEEYQKRAGITEKSRQKDIEKSVETYNKLQKAQADVMQNAEDAYMTAGVDANTYMQNVTGFSAALISSLKGDTEAAAAAAHTAMVDMADNSNKMGTDISAIQNAYQGFAKQNYTMLDNLNNMGALAV